MAEHAVMTLRIYPSTIANVQTGLQATDVKVIYQFFESYHTLAGCSPVLVDYRRADFFPIYFDPFRLSDPSPEDAKSNVENHSCPILVQTKPLIHPI